MRYTLLAGLFCVFGGGGVYGEAWDNHWFNDKDIAEDHTAARAEYTAARGPKNLVFNTTLSTNYAFKSL